MSLRPEAIKEEFPVFFSNPDLVYLDNAATTQMPKSVMDQLHDFHSNHRATVGRGVYELSERNTGKVEWVRSEICNFLNGESPSCFAFTSGTTESINMVAHSLIGPELKKGDNIVITIMEHHANFIPWQFLCNESGAELRIVPLQDYELDHSVLDSMLDENTKILAVTHVSNVLGTVNPLERVISVAHQKGIPVLVDGAQSAASMPVDLQSLDYDFYVCSAHKMFGPFGTGILYAREKFHDQFLPYNRGGGIIESVSRETTSYLDYPKLLEAGTPNVSGIIGLGAALEFLNQLDRHEIMQHAIQLADQFRDYLGNSQEFGLVGPKQGTGVVSFYSPEIHPHDLATLLASERICVRAGRHCAEPLMDELGIPGSVRVSFSLYNTKKDVWTLLETLEKAKVYWS